MNGLTFETICGSYLISSKFNAIAAAYLKHLLSSFLGFIVAFFFFIQSGKLIYGPPCLKSISSYHPF